MVHRRAPLTSSRGSTTTEYLALLLVAALVVGAAGTSLVRSRPEVVTSTAALVCEVVQADGGCARPGRDGAGEDRAPAADEPAAPAPPVRPLRALAASPDRSEPVEPVPAAPVALVASPVGTQCTEPVDGATEATVDDYGEGVLETTQTRSCVDPDASTEDCTRTVTRTSGTGVAATIISAWSCVDTTIRAETPDGPVVLAACDDPVRGAQVPRQDGVIVTVDVTQGCTDAAGSTRACSYREVTRFAYPGSHGFISTDQTPLSCGEPQTYIDTVDDATSVTTDDCEYGVGMTPEAAAQLDLSLAAPGAPTPERLETRRLNQENLLARRVQLMTQLDPRVPADLAALETRLRALGVGLEAAGSPPPLPDLQQALDQPDPPAAADPPAGTVPDDRALLTARELCAAMGRGLLLGPSQTLIGIGMRYADVSDAVEVTVDVALALSLLAAVTYFQLPEAARAGLLAGAAAGRTRVSALFGSAAASINGMFNRALQGARVDAADGDVELAPAPPGASPPLTPAADAAYATWLRWDGAWLNEQYERYAGAGAGAPADPPVAEP